MVGGGSADFFCGQVGGGCDGRIYYHICFNIVGGLHACPAPLENLCSNYF